MKLIDIIRYEFSKFDFLRVHQFFAINEIL